MSTRNVAGDVLAQTRGNTVSGINLAIDLFVADYTKYEAPIPATFEAIMERAVANSQDLLRQQDEWEKTQ